MFFEFADFALTGDLIFGARSAMSLIETQCQDAILRRDENKNDDFDGIKRALECPGGCEECNEGECQCQEGFGSYDCLEEEEEEDLEIGFKNVFLF